MSRQAISGKAFIPDKSPVHAMLTYEDGPKLELDSGEVISDSRKQVIFEMAYESIMDKSDGEIHWRELQNPVRIYLTPRIAVVRKYTRQVQEEGVDFIYPPSTNLFYSRLVKGMKSAQYVVHDVADSEDLWLSIVIPDSGEIQESFSIRRYECDVIGLKTWSEAFEDLTASFSSPRSAEVCTDILSVVDKTKLDWTELHRLTGGSVPPTFTLGSSSRESLSRIIPIERYLEENQDQILAFLTYVAKDIRPEGDIVEFCNYTSSIAYFRWLFTRHMLIRMINPDQDVPAYLNLVKESALGNTSGHGPLPDERGKLKPDYVLPRRVDSLVPDSQNEVMDVVKSLKESGEIVTAYPIPKKNVDSRETQRKRFIMWEAGLRLRAHIRPQCFNLREILFIKSAYRWPTRHTAYSIRLGPESERSAYLQGMIVPPSAAERIIRVLQDSVYDINWSSFTMNPNLYTKKGWRVRETHLLSAFGKTLSFRSLTRASGHWKGPLAYMPSREETRILDMASTMLFLPDLEYEAARRYWQTDASRSKEILQNFYNMGAIDIMYWLTTMPGFTLVFFKIEGTENKVCSIVDALLKDLPTTLARVSDKGKAAIVLSRIPILQKGSLLNRIEQAAKESDVRMQVLFPSSLQNFESDLYQRLLASDGTSWNENISAFLSQARSLPREDLEDILAEDS